MISQFRTILLSVLIIALGGTPLFAQVPVNEQDVLKHIEGTPPEAPPNEIPPPEMLKGDLDEPFKIILDGSVDLNYVFAESPDSFIATYKWHAEGSIKNKIDIVKTKGTIITSVKGFLAKWPTGECQLKIGVGETPMEIIFNKIDDENVRIDVKIDENILESWESNCKFSDAPKAKFNTKGTPEKWVSGALKRIVPSLRDLKIPVDRLHKDTSTLTFNIERYQLPDPPLGSVELEGKGTVQIIPEI
ncbi:MAG: hypothetical protein A3H42_04080 [Deltaproteobacteria bacterium RIFCSPLOWO2_02_FULL_46_8]|nr:MAG: hypothetical protein A3H42_04080 [Deltaproteobacteria bacterium RIFCSPLOWO2_02_FULL_46_8]